MSPVSPRFRYLLDPIPIAALLLYLLGRFYLRPHHIGGLFVSGHLNDLLCLPIFLPLSLQLQRWLRLRPHDLSPRLWEVLQHAIVFSLLFELILPRYPNYYHTTADPLDALSYLAGGLIAWTLWQTPPLRPTHASLQPSPTPLTPPS